MTGDEARRWSGRLSLAVSILATVIAVLAIVGEATTKNDIYGLPVRCSDGSGSWRPQVFFAAVPLLGVLAIVLGAFAVPGVRWRVVLVGCLPLVLVGGLVVVFSAQHPNAYQAWAIFEACYSG
jgi:hypothetical protein